MIKKILVPLDGSKIAENVLPYVEELALKLNAEAAFLSVLPIASRVIGLLKTRANRNEIRLVPQGTCPWKNRPPKYLDYGSQRIRRGKESKLLGSHLRQDGAGDCFLCKRQSLRSDYYLKPRPGRFIKSLSHGKYRCQGY